MFPKIVGCPPKSSIFNRVFHYFHHPFWGFYHYFWKHLHGGVPCPILPLREEQLRNVETITATSRAFAALTWEKTVVAWGSGAQASGVVGPSCLLVAVDFVWWKKWKNWTKIHQTFRCSTYTVVFQVFSTFFLGGADVVLDSLILRTIFFGGWWVGN